MTFEKLMENKSYWSSIDLNEVLIENGDIEQEKNVQVNVGPEDLYDVMSEHFKENIIENEKIIEEAIKIHVAKRYNRKYINACKNLIKDKRYILKRVFSKSDSEMYRQDLVSKNVVSMDNETKVRFIQKEKTRIIIPKFVDNHFYSKFKGYNFEEHIKGKFIVTEKEDIFILESIPFDYTWASYYLSGNIFFYGKPYKNGFVGNINIDKFRHNYNGFISAKAIKIRKIKQFLNILEKEGINEWFQNERNDAFYVNYFDCDWEDFEDENDYYLSDIEKYVKPFLGMDKFYYEDNGGYDLLEKYEEEQYCCTDLDYDYYDDFWE